MAFQTMLAGMKFSITRTQNSHGFFQKYSKVYFFIDNVIIHRFCVYLTHLHCNDTLSGVTTPYTCCTFPKIQDKRKKGKTLRWAVMQNNTVHFRPCDLMFLLCPLLYGVVTPDSVNDTYPLCKTEVDCKRSYTLRDRPFLCTYFKNPNNVWISDDPPTLKSEQR